MLQLTALLLWPLTALAPTQDRGVVDVLVEDAHSTPIAGARVFLCSGTAGLNVAPYLDAPKRLEVARTGEDGRATLTLPVGRRCRAWAIGGAGDEGVASELSTRLDPGQELVLRCEPPMYRVLEVQGTDPWRESELAGPLELAFFGYEEPGMRWTVPLPVEGDRVELPAMPRGPRSAAVTTSDGKICDCVALIPSSRPDDPAAGSAGSPAFDVRDLEPGVGRIRFEGPGDGVRLELDAEGAPESPLQLSILCFGRMAAPLVPIGLLAGPSTSEGGRLPFASSRVRGHMWNGVGWAADRTLVPIQKDGSDEEDVVDLSAQPGRPCEWRLRGAGAASRVLLQPLGTWFLLDVPVDPDGNLRMPATDGPVDRWDLYAMVNGSLIPLYLHPGGEVPSELVLDLASLRTVRVTLEQDGVSAVGGQVRVHPTFARAGIATPPTQFMVLTPPHSPEYPAGPSGVAEIQLLPGRYAFVAGHPELGDGGVEVEVPPGDEPLELSLELEPYRDVEGRASVSRTKIEGDITIEARFAEPGAVDPSLAAIWHGGPGYTRTTQYLDLPGGFRLRLSGHVAELSIEASARSSSSRSGRYRASTRLDGTGDPVVLRLRSSR